MSSNSHLAKRALFKITVFECFCWCTNLASTTTTSRITHINMMTYLNVRVSQDEKVLKGVYTRQHRCITASVASPYVTSP